MPLTIGSRLGPYEVLSPLGAGGMGEVYKGRDTRLDRAVAIKVLAGRLAADTQFRDRFDHEARAISRLDHPHICALYDVGEADGTPYLVMQYLEGETLAARLARSALPLAEALTIAIELAAALSTAHRAGIVHRDLKPGNVMLTKDGVKLLDFGVAKRSTPVVADLSSLPTAPAHLTAEGTFLGTVQYMAPEVLGGQEADARSDIFAFGAVLYEMVTGHRAFEGTSTVDLIGAILKDEPPPVSRRRPEAPPILDRAIARCLAKAPDHRWQTSHDLGEELKWIRSELSVAAQSTDRAAARYAIPLAWAIPLGAALALLAGIVATTVRRPAPAAIPPVARFAVDLPAGVETSSPGGRLAVSADGAHLAFSGTKEDGSVGIYVRAIASLETKLLVTTNGIAVPFFSPDGHWLAFSDAGKLKKVPVAGGAPQPLCDNDETNFASGTWGPDDTIYFVSSREVWKVAASGGTPQRVSLLDRAKGEITHNYPQVVSNGKVLLMTVVTGMGWDESQIEAQFLESGERRLLVRGGKKGYYVQSGHLVYHRSAHEELLAAPFDLASLTVTGESVRLGEHVRSQGLNPEFAISDTGVLAYVAGDARGVERSLSWIDLTGGGKTALAAPPRPYMGARLSPDGSYAAMQIMDASVGIWLYDFLRPGLQPLTPGGSSFAPIWARDSKRVAYGGIRDGRWGIYAKAIDGSDREEQLLVGGEGQVTLPGEWSLDGQQIIVQIVDAEGSDLWVLSLPERKLTRLIKAPSWECCMSLSPDGRWLAYTSNMTGKFEVHLQAFPGLGKRLQISTSGGEDPRWSPNGRELYYFNRAKMMAVDLGSASNPVPKTPRLVFQHSFPQANAGEWDISANGEGFLVLDRTDAERPATEIRVVVNWVQELKQRLK